MPDGTNAQRQARHQQRYEMLVSLYDLALARRPDLAHALGAEVAGILAGNPAMTETFDTLFDRRPHSSPHKLTASLSYTTVINAQATVTNTRGSVTNGGPRLAGGSGRGTQRRGPTGDSVDHGPGPGAPVGGSALAAASGPSAAAFRPSDGAIEVADATVIADDPPHAQCFSVVSAFLWPEGSTRSLNQRTRGQLARAIREMRETLTKEGILLEDQPAFLASRLTARRWANITKGKPKNVYTLGNCWYDVVFGADANGRDHGYVHTAYLNETATHKHQPKFTVPEEYRRD